MTKLLEILEQVKQKIFELLSQIQTTKKVDFLAYESICEILGNALYLMHGKNDIPRALLKEIFFSYQILRAEAPYMGSEQERVLEMAEKLEEFFRLILIDEISE